MSTFNLEQFKSGTPAYTRDGRKVTFLGICDKCDIYPLVGHIEGNGQATNFTLSGGVLRYNSTSKDDLIRMESPYGHLKPGDLVMCWDKDSKPSEAVMRVFLGIDKDFCFVQALSGRRYSVTTCMKLEDYIKQYLPQETS